MNHRKQIARLLVVGFALAFPALLLLGAFRLVLSHEFLRFEYTRPGFPIDPYGFTTENRLELGSLGIDYLLNGAGIDFLGSRTLAAEQCLRPVNDQGACPMFSATELRHMEDVKQITSSLFAIGLGLGLLAFLSAILSWRSSTYRRAIRRGLGLGSLLTLLILGTLAVVGAVTWDKAFDALHELFFAAGTWRFPFSDTLIRLYPERLFVDATIAIVVLIALPCLLVLSLTARSGIDQH